MATILLLHENVPAATLLAMALSDHHYLITAESADQGLQLLRTTHFDLIISRVHLEHDDVFQFLKAVKNDDKLHKIPFLVICTSLSPLANFQHQSVSQIVSCLGAADYLSLNEFRSGADVDLTALRRKVESHLPPQLPHGCADSLRIAVLLLMNAGL